MRKIISLLIFAGITPLLILFPALVETNVSVQSTRLPIGQLLEVVIPMLGVCIIYSLCLGEYLPARKLNFLETIWLMVSQFVFGLFVLGSGIHFSAQTLNQFVMTNRILGELQSVATLFNEKLTHLFWMPGLMFLPFVLAGWELLDYEKSSVFSITLKEQSEDFLRMLHLHPQIKKSFNIISVGGAGSWYGLLIGLALLEAQVAKQAVLLLCLGFLLLGVLGFLKKKLIAPAVLFSLTSSALMITIIVLWRLKFGGFPEPLNVLF